MTRSVNIPRTWLEELYQLRDQADRVTEEMIGACEAAMDADGQLQVDDVWTPKELEETLEVLRALRKLARIPAP